jgi:hypothetical protein
MKKLIVFLLMMSLFFVLIIEAEAQVEFNEQTGYWQVNKKIDPLTDEVKIFIFILCNETIETQTIRPKGLSIRLSRGTVELFVYWDEYLSDNNKIAYRFDKEKVEESRWSLSEDKIALYFPKRKEKLIGFVKRIIEAKELVVGITPYQKGRQTVTFDVRGLGNALLPYLADFGWEDLEETILQLKKDGE